MALSAKIRKYCFGLVAIGMGMVLALIGVEVLLRWLSPFMPGRTGAMVEEAGNLKWNIPRMFRGTSILLPPITDMDVAFVGDSMTFGLNVPVSTSFPSVYARTTGKRHVNLGVVGSDPLDYLDLTRIALKYDPETVVIGVFANDFGVDPGDRSFELDSGRDPEALYLFQTDADDRYESMKARLFGMSRVHSLFAMIRHPAVTRKNWPMTYKDHYFEFADKVYWDQFLVPRFSGDPPVNKVHRCLEHINSLVVGQDTRMMVLLIPTREMVYGPWVDQEDSRLGWKKHTSIYEQLEVKLKESGIPVLNSLGVLRQKAGEGEKLYFSIDGHLTVRGHEVLAQALVSH